MNTSYDRPRLSDEAWEEQQRLFDEAMDCKAASVRASVVAGGSAIGLLQTKMAGLLDEFAVAVRRIDLIEAACFRRLDRVEARVEPLVDRARRQNEDASSTGAPAS